MTCLTSLGLCLEPCIDVRTGPDQPHSSPDRRTPAGCPSGFYLAPGDAATCAACPAGCALCTEPMGLCSQCAPGYQLMAATATCQQRARSCSSISGDHQ